MDSRLSRALLVFAAVWSSGANCADVILRHRSDPPGIVEEDATFQSGTDVTTIVAPAGSNFRFTHWTLVPSAGPVRDTLGQSLNPVVFRILEDVVATANYLPAGQDSDADGLPDHYEIRELGTLATATSASDLDGDGYSYLLELLFAYHPTLFEFEDAGGVSATVTPAVRVVTAPGQGRFRTLSNPPGFQTRDEILPLGSIVDSGFASDAGNFRFAYWESVGASTTDMLGIPLNPIQLVVDFDTLAYAHYFSASRDVDGDGVPDWIEFRQVGSLGESATSDGDGDGIPFAAEVFRGTSAVLADSYVEGGVSATATFPTTLRLGTAVRYVFSSVPPGVIQQQGTLQVGTSVTSPVATVSASGTFAYWTTTDGGIERDALGMALNPVSLVATADSPAMLEGIATYVGNSVDVDADGLSDAIELRYASDLTSTATSDADGDGASFASELRRGQNPLLQDSFVEGGVSSTVSVPSFVDFRPFPRIREVLSEGIPDVFFAREPSGAGTVGSTFQLDANTSPALGDWDGDRDLDLFVAGTVSGATTIRVYANRGSTVVPNFERATPLEGSLATLASAGVSALSLGDADADGRAELAIGDPAGNVTVLKSPGSFTGSASTLFTVATGSAASAVGIADATNDGLPDLLAVQPDGTTRAWVHSGNNGAPFAVGASSDDVLPDDVPAATSLSSADITEDGNPDILISDASGRIWEFHRQLAGGYRLNSRIFAGTSPGYANRLAGAVGDLDGDGDGDVVAGFAEGGLVYLRNQVEKLSIDPTVKTLVAGQGIAFALRDPGAPESPVGPIQWRFVSNRSGGTLDPSTGAYVSGGTSRRVDVIEAEDARGVTGRTYVNVIDPADQTQVGKAIIVAGGLGTSDAIWGATRTTANRTYRALLHRGYRKQDIRYLSLAYGEALGTADRIAVNDLDGNGIANDELFGLPLRTTLEQSITQWASGAADLVVVMVDHGVGQQFTLNGTSKLTATELDAWLDVQQAGGGDVALVLDYCFSGSFLDALKSAPGDRVVLASAAADQPAFLFDGGEVSFSQAVARGIFQGFDLETTFLQAQEAMAKHQAAQLDDDGSGAYVPAQDGALARTKVIGPTYAVGQDIPVIETIEASVPSPDGRSLIRTLGAEGSSGVVSVHPLVRVWCTVEAPGAVGQVPQSNLPEVPLVFNRETRAYEAEVGGFVEPGNYSLSCYAKDIHASVSFPATTTVARAQGHEARIVVVVAGEPADPEWTQARAIGDATLQTALARGYAANQVYFLSRGNPPLPNGCVGTCAPTDANLGTALGSWLGAGNGLPAANEVTLFLVGSGVTRGALSLGASETLDADLLDQRLDAFQDGAAPGVVRPVNVIVDHADDACSGQGTAFNSLSPANCGAGSLVRELSPQANEAPRDRTVLVSSGQNQPNVRLSGGTVSFMQLFLSHALENRSLGDAAREARDTLDLVTRTTASVQRPYVDFVTPGGRGVAGVPNENADIQGLRTRFLGGLVRSTPPRTTGMASVQGPVGNPVTIFVKANAGEPARNLEAIVTPPGGMAGEIRVVLVLDPETQRYEGEYTPTLDGEHGVLIVETAQGLTSVPDEATIMAGGSAPGVALAVETLAVQEGSSLTITSQLSSASPQQVVVPFTLTGDAGLQVDYDVDALNFVFAPGQTSSSITLTAIADARAEPAETLVLALGESADVVVSPPSETRVTIADPVVSQPDDLFDDSFE